MASNSQQIDDLKSVDEEIIRGNKMLQELYSTLQEHLKKDYLNYARIVLHITDDNEEIYNYLNLFQESFNETFMELINDIQKQKQEKVNNSGC